MKGAQQERYIIKPTEDVMNEIFSRGEGIIARISGAPEIDGMSMLAERAKNS